MPPLPSPGRVIKLNLNWGVDGDTLAETIHFFAYTGTVDAGDLDTFTSNAVSSAEAEFQALATSFTGVLQATARDLSSDMGLEATGGTPWTGTRTGDRLSPGTAAVVSHSISRHYRGGHPRSYLPLGSGTDVASTGLWADAFVTAVDTAWGAFVADIKGAWGAFSVTDIVNVSYYGPPNRTITGSTGRVRTVSTVRAVPIVDTITGHTVNKRIGSQRRRNRDA